MKFKDKVVFITGGTGELGASVVRKFLSEGALVVASYISEIEKEKFAYAVLKKFSGVELFKANFINENEVEAAFSFLKERFGKLDVLCNLVGGYMEKIPLTDLSEKSWDVMMDLNLKSCFFSMKHGLRIMNERKEGRIINVSAMAGIMPDAGRGAYGVSKGAVVLLTKIAAAEVKADPKSRITVNAIAPSILTTKSNEGWASAEEMASWVTLEQAAETIAYLASEEASAINGQVIGVYGRK
ncbi:MAG: SDR family oxidoreductase [Bacteroidota bacterium]|nr:SDR family oxidoreductase [Bacteroidota bacterium]